MLLRQKIKTNEWTKWYAWRPITTIQNELVIFEVVERQIKILGNFDHSYEEIQYRRLRKHKFNKKHHCGQQGSVIN